MNPIDRRATPRFRVQFRTTLFGSGPHEGVGILQDLSLTGCRVQCGAPLQQGLPLELRIHVPDLEWPLMIDTAQVQWVRGQIVGLAFLRVKDAEQQRLDRVIAGLKEDSGIEDDPTAIRLVA